MQQKNLLGAAALGLIVLGLSGTAQAGPTATINGITFPIRIVPGGDQLQSGILAENVISNVGEV